MPLLCLVLLLIIREYSLGSFLLIAGRQIKSYIISGIIQLAVLVSTGQECRVGRHWSYGQEGLAPSTDMVVQLIDTTSLGPCSSACGVSGEKILHCFCLIHT
jgi:hypothetical protein